MNAIEKVDLQRKLDHQRAELLCFSRVLAHDLKAPIRHIRTGNELIQTKVAAKEFDEEFDQWMGYLSKAANTMDALIDALSAYTHFDTEVQFAEVSLEECVAMAVSFLENMLKEKSAQIHFRSLPKIWGNEAEIIQLFQNLIANALKFNESDAPIVEISAHNTINGCQIAIKDNGIGIPEKHYSTIFKPLKRLHGSDSKYKGSGLGLATCKKIVERHGGTISCHSEMNQGTTFLITLSSNIVLPALVGSDLSKNSIASCLKSDASNNRV